MASATEMPSLIDDANFLAELDKLESAPAPPEALAAFWDQASLVDETGEGRLAAGTLAPPGPAPRQAPPVPHTRSVKPQRPVRPEKRLKLDTDSGPGRIEMPSRPEGPARSERPLQPKRPVRPAHVDEVGQSRRTRETEERAVSNPQSRRVPGSIAALTVVLCFCAGAGSAALVFHDRVSVIVAQWTSASR